MADRVMIAAPTVAGEGLIGATEEGLLTVPADKALRVWEPWEIRCVTGLDHLGQDTLWRFVSVGTTMYYTEPLMVDGLDEITIWVMPGMHNAGANRSPYCEVRLYSHPHEQDGWVGPVIWYNAWTNQASGSHPSAAAFQLRNWVHTSGAALRGTHAAMIDVGFRGDASDAALLVPWTIRVIGKAA